MEDFRSLELEQDLEARYGSNGSRHFRTRNYERRNPAAPGHTPIQHHNRRYRSVRERRHHNGRTATRYSGSSLSRRNGQRQFEMSSNSNRGTEFYNTNSVNGFDLNSLPPEDSVPISIQQNQNHNRRHRQRDDHYPSRNSNSSMHNDGERRHRNERSEYRNQRRRHNDSYTGYSFPRRNGQRQSEMSTDSNYGPEFYNTLLPGEEIMADSGASQNTQDVLLFTDIQQRLSLNSERPLQHIEQGRSATNVEQRLSGYEDGGDIFSSLPHIEQGRSATSTASVNGFDLNSLPIDLNSHPQEDSVPPSPVHSEPPSPVEHHGYHQISFNISSHVLETTGYQFLFTVPLPSAILFLSGLDVEFQLTDDDLTYEDTLALQERMGVVEKGLPEESIEDHLKTRKYTSKNSVQETEICVVCQDEYKDREIIGKLDCGHEYHANCIKKWLLTKNECPICKQEALKI